jgi:hypothetical protein
MFAILLGKKKYFVASWFYISYLYLKNEDDFERACSNLFPNYHGLDNLAKRKILFLETSC